MINLFKRYQKGLTLNHLYPQNDKSFCACGCGKKLIGNKKRWATKHCQETAVSNFFIIKGDTAIIRKELFKRDMGICSCCGENSDKWEADHILPVFLGGGACDLDNFQTLCIPCHKTKTLYHTLSHHNAISSQAIFMSDIRFANAVGATS